MNQIPNIEETNTREQCDCSKYPEQQEVGGHGRYCKHHTVEEIEEHEMTPFEQELAQTILSALEYRGFYDCGKYLDTSLIEHIRPLIHQQLQKAREEERERIFSSIEDYFLSSYPIPDAKVMIGYINADHSKLDQDKS